VAGGVHRPRVWLPLPRTLQARALLGCVAAWNHMWGFARMSYVQPPMVEPWWDQACPGNCCAAVLHYAYLSVRSDRWLLLRLLPAAGPPAIPCWSSTQQWSNSRRMQMMRRVSRRSTLAGGRQVAARRGQRRPHRGLGGTPTSETARVTAQGWPSDACTYHNPVVLP